MIIVDAGPIIALLDPRDKLNSTARGITKLLKDGPLISTWPCFVEAMYMLGARFGNRGHEALWNFWEKNELRLHSPDHGELARQRVLMQTYHDVPMDFADASLVTLAANTSRGRLLTTDSHFRIYLLAPEVELTVIE